MAQEQKSITDLTIDDLKRLIKDTWRELIQEEQWEYEFLPGLEQRAIINYLAQEFDPTNLISHENLRSRLANKGSTNWANDIIKDREERI